MFIVGVIIMVMCRHEFETAVSLNYTTLHVLLDKKSLRNII